MPLGKWRKLVNEKPPLPAAQDKVPGPNSAHQPDQHDDDAPDDPEAHMAQLCREGGVEFVNYLLAKAVPPHESLPQESNIREWTHKDIMNLPPKEKEAWKAKCREELEALCRRKVFDLVDRPKGRKVMKNRWVFDIKSDGRKKARLVAKGFSQVEGIDFDQIFSPVVRFETVRLILALAALEDWHIQGVDVKNAYLYGKLDEEIYMEQPEGFKVKGQEHKVFRLLCALYGLKQAGLAWWKALNESMELLGCKHLSSDAGIFVYKDKNGGTVVIVVYVDDALFCGKDKALVAKLKADFMKQWECRDLDETKEFLRMRIKRDRGKIYIDQVPYLEKVLHRFGMQNSKTAPTPLPSGYMPLENKSRPDPELRQRFQGVIGSLLYIMIGTRPDIAYAVTKLSQFSANPSQEHLDKVLYICRYLVGTKNYALVFDGPSQQGLIAYADADWAGDLTTCWSISGNILKLANGTCSWLSRTQKTVALSSTEAEYMSLSDCSCQVVWVRSLLEEIGYQLDPIPICGDNQGSIFIASNPVQEQRSKHIDIRYHYIREVVTNRKVEILFVDGSENPADMFTKNLGHVKFLKFRAQLGLEFYSPSNT